MTTEQYTPLKHLVYETLCKAPAGFLTEEIERLVNTGGDIKRALRGLKCDGCVESTTLGNGKILWKVGQRELSRIRKTGSLDTVITAIGRLTNERPNSNGYTATEIYEYIKENLDPEMKQTQVTSVTSHQYKSGRLGRMRDLFSESQSYRYSLAKKSDLCESAPEVSTPPQEYTAEKTTLRKMVHQTLAVFGNNGNGLLIKEIEYWLLDQYQHQCPPKKIHTTVKNLERDGLASPIIINGETRWIPGQRAFPTKPMTGVTEMVMAAITNLEKEQPRPLGLPQGYTASEILTYINDNISKDVVKIHVSGVTSGKIKQKHTSLGRVNDPAAKPEKYRFFIIPRRASRGKPAPLQQDFSYNLVSNVLSAAKTKPVPEPVVVQPKPAVTPPATEKPVLVQPKAAAVAEAWAAREVATAERSLKNGKVRSRLTVIADNLHDAITAALGARELETKMVVEGLAVLDSFKAYIAKLPE